MGPSRRTRASTGVPVWTGLQLDEVADPIILAYQLHRYGAQDWAHVKKAADFLLELPRRTVTRRRGRRWSAGRTRTATPPRRSPARSPDWCVPRRSRARTATPRRRSGTCTPPTAGARTSRAGRVTSTGPLLGEAVLPAAHEGRPPEPRHDVRDRRRRPEQRRPAQRRRPELPRTRPARRVRRARPGHPQQPDRDRPAAVLRHAARTVLASRVLRRLRRIRHRRRRGTSATRTTASSRTGAAGRCSTASAASTTWPPAVPAAAQAQLVDDVAHRQLRLPAAGAGLGQPAARRRPARHHTRARRRCRQPRSPGRMPSSSGSRRTSPRARSSSSRPRSPRDTGADGAGPRRGQRRAGARTRPARSAAGGAHRPRGTGRDRALRPARRVRP